jgi:putative FmdB family regulatory protein
MPRYDYECDNCGFVDEEYSLISESEKIKECPHCGGKWIRLVGCPEFMVSGKGLRDKKGERIWFPKDEKPYFDRSLQVTFNSAREKKEYLDKHNLVMDGSQTKMTIDSGDMRDKTLRKQLKMED